MTSRERLLAAMRLEEVDRTPLHVRGVRPWDDNWTATRDPSYAPLIAAVAAQGDYVDSWSPASGIFYSAASVPTESYTEENEDWIATYTLLHTPDGTLRSMFLSSKRGLPGMQREFFVKEREDLEKVLSVPYVPLQPDCRSFFTKAEKMGERGLVLVSLPNAITMLHNLMGSERPALWSVIERPRLLALLWEFHRRCRDLLEYLLFQGVGPVFALSGEEYVTPPLHGPHDFREFVVEPERELAALIHRAGGLLHIHCHGPLSRILEDFLVLDVDCLHPLEPPPLGDVPLADARQRIGHRICLEGNIQIGDLYVAPTEQIVAQVRHNVELMGRRGYIVCPTASPHTTVLSEHAVRNYLAMIQTVWAYG